MNSTCSLCGCQDAPPAFIKGPMAYHRCRVCAFVFSRPPENANFQGSLDDYEPAYLQYLEEAPQDEKNFDVLWAWLSRLGPLTGARVLDIGCGSGKLVRYLRRRSVHAYGLEPSRVLYDHFLTGEPGLFGRSFREVTEISGSQRFDVVTALDVIEHVDQPNQFLADISRRLEPGGVAYISTPDVGSVLARLTGKRWHHFNQYHLGLFSRRTLTDAAAHHDLRLESCARRGRLRSVGYILRYLRDFVTRGGRLRLPAWLDGVAFPLNLFDSIHVCFKKEVTESRSHGVTKKDHHASSFVTSSLRHFVTS